MGYSMTYGLVYGVPFKLTGKLAEDAEEAIDIEFLISDNYSLLEYDSTGRTDDEFQSMVTIPTMGVTSYGEPMIDISEKVKKSPSAEELEQLNEFCTKYALECKPSWYIYGYYG